MRLLLALLASVVLGMGASACGAGKVADSASPVSSNVPATGGAPTSGARSTSGATPSIAMPRIIPDTASTRGYLNDGDHDHIGDPDSDNSRDNDNDVYYDYKPDDNRNYHDSDDHGTLDYGRAASGAQARAITAAVKHYYATAAAGGGASACSQLVPDIAKSAPVVYGQFGAAYLRGANTCAAVMVRLFKHSHGQLVHPMRVTDVRVQGSTALVLFGSRTMPASSIAVTREGGAWKMTTLLGSPLP